VTEAVQPEPDEKDWTWVLLEPCPECGYDAATTALEDIPALTLDAAARLASAVRAPGATTRPSPATWSALEYGCHVRDVCLIFAGRVDALLTQDDPSFANWDQDATAIADHYGAQDPRTVATELQAAAAEISVRFAAVPKDAWRRPGRRSNGSIFTVESLARYFLHDLVHHAYDVGS
jgi:hypothetical protein